MPDLKRDGIYTARRCADPHRKREVKVGVALEGRIVTDRSRTFYIHLERGERPIE